MWVLGPGAEAASLIVRQYDGRPSLAHMWVSGLCASIRIANGRSCQVSRSIVRSKSLVAMTGRDAGRRWAGMGLLCNGGSPSGGVGCGLLESRLSSVLSAHRRSCRSVPSHTFATHTVRGRHGSAGKLCGELNLNMVACVGERPWEWSVMIAVAREMLSGYSEGSRQSMNSMLPRSVSPSCVHSGIVVHTWRWFQSSTRRQVISS